VSDISADAPARPDDRTTSGYSYYVLGVLTLVYTFNFIDRQIIAILSPAIQEDLGLSDSMMGLLKGLAFAMLYTVMGIPIAWLADRWNRVSIVSASLAVWSGFTALSGFAANAAQLTLARIGVGIGEAGCSPPAHALISDYFPKERRASALSIYSLGIPFGQMFAFLAGGWVLQTFGWRNAFFIVGAPGVVLAIVMKLTVREPKRGALDGPAPAAGVPAGAGPGALAPPPPPVSYAEGLKRLLSIPTYWGVTIGVTLASFTAYGIGLWVVDFYRRTYGLSYVEITTPLAFLNGAAYGLGAYLGGRIADRCARKDKGAYAWLPGAAMLVTIPAGVLNIWAPTPFWAFFWAAPFLLMIGFYLGPSFSLVQTLAPVRLRAMATAFFFLVLNLVALGFGPLWVGALSDFFAASHGDVTGLRIALTTLSIFSLASALVFFWTAKKVPADWEKATGEAAA